MSNDLFKNKATGEIVGVIAGVLKMGKLRNVEDLGAMIIVRETKSKQCMAYLASDFYKTHIQMTKT